MKQLPLDIGLAPGATYQSFVAGPNEAVRQHLTHWLQEQPGLSMVPIYLWGVDGSGKTHLLRATQAALRDRGISVGWLDPTLHDPPEFSEDWAAVLLDDVDSYGTDQQHTAFNWFINAQTLQRGVLAAGRVPPSDLTLRDDLRTRLGWGHVFQLQVLDESERRAVLRQAADARGVFLGDDVMDFMLTRFSRDLGSLMDLLDMIDRYAMQTKRSITIPLIKAMLEESD